MRDDDRIAGAGKGGLLIERETIDRCEIIAAAEQGRSGTELDTEGSRFIDDRALREV